MTRAWVWLIIAGLFEVGWPLGLKVTQAPGRFAIGMVAAVSSMVLSGVFLWLAQKQIPMGTAYLVWTGIGGVGTFALGLVLFREPMTVVRVTGALLILCGVVLLKLGH